jgi:hypothetical protein
MTIKRIGLGTMAASALASAAIGLATTANAAPTAPSAAETALGKLQVQGYHVIVNRVGMAPLDMCSVSGVRPGQTFSRMDSGSGAPGSNDDIVTTVTSMTVFLDLSC